MQVRSSNANTIAILDDEPDRLNAMEPVLAKLEVWAAEVKLWLSMAIRKNEHFDD